MIDAFYFMARGHEVKLYHLHHLQWARGPKEEE